MVLPHDQGGRTLEFLLFLLGPGPSLLLYSTRSNTIIIRMRHTVTPVKLQLGSWSDTQATDRTERQLIRKADSWSDRQLADQAGRQLFTCSDRQAAVQTGRQPFRQDICECSVRGLLFFCSRSVCVSYFLRACLDYEQFSLMHSEYCKFKISTNFDVYSDGKFCWVRTEHMRNTNTPFEHKNSLYFAIKTNKGRKF